MQVTLAKKKMTERMQGRKQKREPLKDKSAVRKARCSRGQSYSLLCKKGKEKNRMPKRQIKSTCGNCRNNCTQVISNEEKNAIFSDYWQHGDLTKQSQFIVENVTSLPKKRKRREGQRRSFTYKCSLNRNIVCKTMFLNTLSTLEKTVRTALLKRDENGILVKT